MAKPIQIGSIIFPTQKAAMDHARTIRDRYKDGEIIKGEDDIFLRNLINLHSEKDEKIDVGITHFTVGKDRRWTTTRCFYLVRRNGTATDFSFENCIKGKNLKQDILDAFRTAIAGQVISFKLLEFSKEKTLLCPINGISLTEENCDVDHVAPSTLGALVALWLKENNLSLLEINLVKNADNQWARTLRDEDVVTSWQQFHLAKATLRIVSKGANRSRKI